MIFRSRSLGCSILLLLMVLGATSNISRFVILQSGMLPVHPGDVSMCFYATVQNTGVEPQTVQLNMKRCCLEMADGSVECNAMKLQHGFSVRLHANKTFNLTAYFINKNLFGRNGECELKLMSLSAGEALTEFKIQFNTTSSKRNFFESIYSTMMGEYIEENKNTCDAWDMDCHSSECVLDNSGTRSFYNKKKKRCEETPECSNEEQKMLSPVTNLCRDQYPSSLVVHSLTPEMKAGINDTDSDLQKVNPVEAVKVICVHGKMDANGHCKCDENWLSAKFEPQKLDPQKTPYYMCNVRSPEGEVTDRIISTGYAYTVLIILVVILLPCCTGIGIILIYVHQRNQKRKKNSIALLSEDLASSKNQPDKSADVISEVISRRETNKSSTSRRSSNGQEQTTRSVTFVKDSQTNSNHSPHNPPSSPHDPPSSPHDPQFSPDDPPSSPHDPPSSPHDPPPSPHDPPPGPHSSNVNQGNSNHKPNPSKQASKTNPSNTSTRNHIEGQSYHAPDGHRHPTTSSHVYWRTPHPGENTPANFRHDNYLQDFQEIPLIDLDHAEYNDYHENSAFRSRSAPVMNISYSTPELVAVSDNPESSTTAYFSTSRSLTPIPELNDNNKSTLGYRSSDAHVETSETDVRASVKKKQELWSRFLQNYSELHPIRQHSEFGIPDTVRNSPQVYQARSLPIMHPGESFTQRKSNNNLEEIYNLPDTRTYTVFTPEQQSVTSISPITPKPIAIAPPFHIPSKVDVDEVEKMLLAAMKSKGKIYPTEQNIEVQDKPIRPNFNTGETIAASTSAEKGTIIARENLTFPELERLDSLILLRRLSQDNNSREGTPLDHSSSETSDIAIGSPIGPNKWFGNLSAMGNDKVLKSQRLDSMVLLEKRPQKYTYKADQIPEPASSDSSDILIGSPIGRNRFWIQQFTTVADNSNGTPNANVENETNPYQLTTALKKQLKTPTLESYNSSDSSINPYRVANHLQSEGYYDETTRDATIEQIFSPQQPPLAEQDANTTFR